MNYLAKLFYGAVDTLWHVGKKSLAPYTQPFYFRVGSGLEEEEGIGDIRQSEISHGIIFRLCGC